MVFIGLILLAGIEKLACCDSLQNPLYKAFISIRRFENIRQMMKFDDKRTRDRRIKTDRLATFLYMWEMFCPIAELDLPRVNMLLSMSSSIANFCNACQANLINMASKYFECAMLLICLRLSMESCTWDGNLMSPHKRNWECTLSYY